MKKIIYALAALSVTALMGLTSCSKNEPASTNPYSEILAMNQHIGKSAQDVRTALTGNGWTEVGSLFIFDKTINNNNVRLDVSLDENETQCKEICAYITDPKYLEYAKALIFDATETYKFETLGETASFNSFSGKIADDNYDKTESYTEAKDWLNNRTYTSFNGVWLSNSPGSYNGLMIQNNPQNQLISVAIGSIY